MDKNENKNKKLDEKELNNISGGKFSEEQLEKFKKFAAKNHPPMTAYGMPNPGIIIDPKLLKPPSIKKPEATENTDTSKSDVISELSGDTSSKSEK